MEVTEWVGLSNFGRFDLVCSVKSVTFVFREEEVTQQQKKAEQTDWQIGVPLLLTSLIGPRPLPRLTAEPPTNRSAEL